ncbi:TetR/AcrR family transcriptional regulator [Streptomyces sp. NPDC048603]|uniref:TetR/AcrR family transcriptional regulator n=1 Tax=Streptomyces sp. NPDC048603 TaxID=3365577 RepID=UPI00371E6104
MSQGKAPRPETSRRERQRRATIDEIKQVARVLLVDEGIGNVTIRAIAREMGMTPPAVYRYFASHDGLLRAIRTDIFTEVAAYLRTSHEALPMDDSPGRLIAAARALRRWGLEHQREFGLLLGPNAPGAISGGESALEQDAGWVFGVVFADLMSDLWRNQPFPVPPPGALPAQLADQLNRLRADRNVDLPVEAIAVMLRCWVRLYGLICMEVLGHLQFALDDGVLFFERELSDCCATLGITARLNSDCSDPDTTCR